MKVRRALLSELSDAAYDTVQSFHSDSAVCFSIFLHHLPDLPSQHTPNALLHAMEVLCRISACYSTPLCPRCCCSCSACCMPKKCAQIELAARLPGAIQMKPVVLPSLDCAS